MMAFSRAPTFFRGAVAKLTSLITASSRELASVVGSHYETIILERKGENQNVGIITFNRPKALNALCNRLVEELNDALAALDKDESVSAVIITGSEKAFAAGSDMDEILPQAFPRVIIDGFLENFNTNRCRKPIIAAVNGFAVGGGCELALMCDIIYAGEKTVFWLPEVSIGIIPGAGGTQRIARSCGKSNAMQICLTGDQFSAQEAERMGLVSKVFPVDQVLPEAIMLADRICKHSPLIAQLCKESVNAAFETTLQQGLQFERLLAQATFATVSLI